MGNCTSLQSSDHNRLISACKSGNIREISGLIAALRQKSNTYNLWVSKSPILIAAERGNQNVVSLLLEHYPDHINTANDGITPLMAASTHGHDSIVRLLLEKRADATIASPIGTTALFLASRSGHASIANALLSSGAFIDYSTAAGETPLFCAVEHGHRDVVEVLLSHGARPHWRNQTGLSPVLLACRYGHLEVLRYLLERRGSLEDVCVDGLTPLMHACSRGQNAIVAFLLGDSPLPSSSQGVSESPELPGRLESSDYPISRVGGGEINRVAPVMEFSGNDYNNPLVDVNASNRDNRTALQVACSNGHITTVRLLLAHQADLNAVHPREGTVLGVACEKGENEVVKVLLGTVAEMAEREFRERWERHRDEETRKRSGRARDRATRNQAGEEQTNRASVDVRVAVRWNEEGKECISSYAHRNSGNFVPIFPENDHSDRNSEIPSGSNTSSAASSYDDDILSDNSMNSDNNHNDINNNNRAFNHNTSYPENRMRYSTQISGISIHSPQERDHSGISPISVPISCSSMRMTPRCLQTPRNPEKTRNAGLSAGDGNTSKSNRANFGSFPPLPDNTLFLNPDSTRVPSTSQSHPDSISLSHDYTVHMQHYVSTAIASFVNIADTTGRTPLMRAACGGHESIITTLLRCKADIHAEDEDGRNVCMYVCMGGYGGGYGRGERAERHGTGIGSGGGGGGAFGDGGGIVRDAANNTGMDTGTPTRATTRKLIEIIKLLQRHGADVNHHSKHNLTVLSMACAKKNSELASALVEMCRLSKDMWIQCTDEAVWNGAVDVLKVMLRKDIWVKVRKDMDRVSVEKERRRQRPRERRARETTEGGKEERVVGDAAEDNRNNQEEEQVIEQAEREMEVEEEGGARQVRNVRNIENVSSLQSSILLHDDSIHNNDDIDENDWETPDELRNRVLSRALCVASARSHTDIVQMLLHTKVSPNVRDITGVSALLLAIQNYNILSVRSLLMAKADPNVRMSNNTGIIPSSTHANNFINPVDNNVSHTNNSNNPRMDLHIQDLPTLSLHSLDFHSLDVHSLDLGIPAVVLAAQKNLSVVCKMLLEAKADVNARIRRVEMCAHTCAVSFTTHEHSSSAPDTQLIRAQCLHDPCSMVNPTNININNPCTDAQPLLRPRPQQHHYHIREGASALVRACERRSWRIAKQLIQDNAELNFTDFKGHSALWHACAQQWVEGVLDLVMKGANVNIRDSSGDSALACACRSGQVVLVEVLLDANADINALDHDYRSPLHHAASHGQDNVVRMLISAKARVLGEDREGTTVLMESINGRCYSDVVELVLGRICEELQEQGEK